MWRRKRNLTMCRYMYQWSAENVLVAVMVCHGVHVLARAICMTRDIEDTEKRNELSDSNMLIPTMMTITSVASVT
jgi:hypothetical protein